MSFILPSPNTAKDLNSFLQPLINKLLELENGVQAFDGHTNTAFQMRAWVTLVTGRRCMLIKFSS